jgi:hypothetical protein
VPEACSLPTAVRPLRLAEFDDLLRTGRLAPTRLRWVLDPAAEPVGRCCSFFTFTVSQASEGLVMDVTVPSAYIEVLDALAERSVAA